ncbi:MAG: Ig-like domain-containing protein [Archaeoglobaceae archaeon]|nr:Ig-like domain-containing protein [Archaeoglobaceae archaeon]MCX8152389.1 Ig-like domain-containing protein [Archaeoglobaceae archaeon]MDW8013729.1 Ig-like domain-containing protein [Archaeoglobaceae archaeon]
MFSTNSSSIKTRISAHLSDAAPIEGEMTSLEGWLTFYDEEKKIWKPLKGKISVFLNGIKVGECESNELGAFSFSFKAPSIGKHKIDLKYSGYENYESSHRSLEIQTLSGIEKRRILKIAKVALFLIFILIIISLITIYLIKILY